MEFNVTTAVTEALTEAVETGVQFDPSQFVNNLPYMGKGMLGIFVVIGIIIAITYILNKFSKKKQ